MSVERRTIAALSVACLGLIGVTVWALATRDSRTPSSAEGSVYWVAIDGDDAGPGTRDEPWATLQHAADSVGPGATVYVREGVYEQRVEVRGSGTPGRPITFAAAPGERVVLDGSSLEVPAGQNAMIAIDSQRYVTIRGFEITGYRSDVSGHVPIGILVTGAADHVRLAGNVVHDLGTTFEGRNGGDAHGIGVFGTAGDHPIEEVEIVDNELANLTLGSSEALVVNGNVKDFLIEGNEVHDTNNIGIDVIGFEGTAPDPTVDQARDGIVRGNEVWNVDSYGNPAYGNDRSADGIYVDGGRDILIEGNTIHDVNIGIELASEHAGRSTRNITARNNLVYDATAIGIAIGGYDRRRGSTEDCVIVNNTVVNTDGVELLVQFDTRNNVIANNVIVAGARHVFVENDYRENVGNVLDHNLYFSVDGGAAGHVAVEGRRVRRTSIDGARAPGTIATRSSPIPGSRTRRRTTTRSGPARPPSTRGRSWPRPVRPISPATPVRRPGGSTWEPSSRRRRRPHPLHRSRGPSPTRATSRGSGRATGGGRPRSIGATASAPPTTAGRSGSAPRRSTTGSGRTRRRGSSWSLTTDVRSSSRTSDSTRRSAIEVRWCSRCGATVNLSP